MSTHEMKTMSDTAAECAVASERDEAEARSRSRLRRRLLGLLTVLLLGGAPATAQTPGTQTALAIGEPSEEFESPPSYDDCMLFASSDKTLYSTGAYSKHDRSVQVRARYFIGGDRSKEVESTREWRTAYFPTWIATVSENVMCVAGKRPTGNTVLELWTFTPPQHSIEYSQQGAPPKHVVSIGERTVTTLYDADVAGRRTVRTCSPVFGAASQRILVQFADSNELSVFDVATSAWTLVATPDSQHAVGSTVHLPLLMQKFRYVRVFEHATYGWCYFLSDLSDAPPDDLDAATTLFLYDQDKNGVIEHALQLSANQFDALGFCSASSFLTNWKY